MQAEEAKRTLDNWIVTVVVLLMAIGTAFVFSAAASIQQGPELSKFCNLQAFRQIIFFPVAVVLLCVTCAVDYRILSLEKGWMKSPATYLLLGSTVLLVLVLIPGLGTEINQARRWLRIPAGPFSISFQPSELGKWVLVIFLAGFCSRYRETMRQYRRRFIPICIVIVAVVGLVVKEDFGSGALICVLSFAVLLIGGVRWWHPVTLVPLAATGFGAALLSSPGRVQRIAAFLRPDEWAGTAAYQANQSLIALGSGGLWGKGLGRGVCKYGHLPEDTTDFIFAIIGEELGFFGSMLVIGLFIVFIWLGILVVVRCRDHFGQILAAGIVLTIGMQAALNIGVVTVVLPTKGIPLPFVSAGGTGMLLSACAVGILVNIAKQSPRPGIAERGE